MNLPVENKFITTREAHDVSGYSPDYLARLARSKKIIARRIGRAWIIEEHSLQEFIKTQGTHKANLATELSRVREAEYRTIQSPVNRVKRALTTPVLAPLSSATVTSWKKEALAMGVALMVVGSGAYVAHAGNLERVAGAGGEIALSAANGFSEIALNIASHITAQAQVVDRAQDAAHLAALGTIAGTSENISSEFLARPNVSVLALATGVQYRAAEAPVVALQENNAREETSIPPISFSAHDLIALASPKTLTGIAKHAYTTTGQNIYDAAIASLVAYRSLIETAGASALALGTETRDTLARAPGAVADINLAFGEAVISAAHFAVYSDMSLAYGISDAAPASARATLAVADTLGGSVEIVGGAVAKLAAIAPKEIVHAAFVAGPRTASAAWGLEYALARGFIAGTNTVLALEWGGIHGAGNAAYETTAGTARVVAFVSSAIPRSDIGLESAILGVAGKSALAFENLKNDLFTTPYGKPFAAALTVSGQSLVAAATAAAPALTGGEQAALYTYTTIRGLFESANASLAELLGPPPTIVLPNISVKHVATATSTTPVTHNSGGTIAITTHSTYNTYVNGVSTDFVNQSLQAMRAGILSDVAKLMQPVQQQVATNITTIQQVNMIQSIGDLTLHHPIIDGAEIASSNFSGGITLSSGTTTTPALVLSTISGLTQCLQANPDGSVSGTGIPCGSGTGGPAATSTFAFVTATSTTATSTFMGNVEVDGDALLANATSTNFFASVIHGTLGVFDTLSAGTLALTNALGVTNGGTGLAVAPSYGQVLLGNSTGGYDLVATSSLGIVSATAPVWGSIVGTLSDQTDLQNALNAKFDTAAFGSSFYNFFHATTTSALAEGSNLYFTNNRVASVIAGTTTDALAQGLVNKYYATNLFAADLAGTTTDALREGSNSLYWTNTRFDNRLSATTTLPNITALANLGMVSTSLTGLLKAAAGVLSSASAGVDYENPLTFTYPLVRAANAISLAFGTSTSNTWGGTQTFTNNPILGTLTGLIYGNNGVLATAATSTLNIGGNAGTATALQTPRLINGVAFDGTGDISVPAAANTLTGTTLANNVVTSSLTSLGTLISLAVSGQTNLGNASSTAFSSNYASSTNAFFGNLSVGNLSGVVHALGGTLSAGAVNLATEVSGLLSVANGGTGQASLFPNAVLLGNGSGAVATTSAGTNGQVLALVGGVPTWVATTSINNLSFVYPLVNTANSVSLAFGTTTANSWSALQQFNGGASTTQLSASGQAFFADGTASAPGIAFTNNPNTGISNSSGTINISSAGTTRLTIGSTIIVGGAVNSSSGSGFSLQNGTAVSATSPNIIPDKADLTTGFAAGTLGNINAIVGGSEVTRWTQTGFGIGTTSPLAKLSVNGTAAGTTPLFDLATSTAGFATSTALFVDANGNLSLQNGAGLTLSGATTTASNGINISAGCFAVGGNCIGTANTFAGTLAVSHGGTGWGNVVANSILLGNGTGAFATTSAGTNGQVLALVNGIPTWQATTTLANISGNLSQLQGGTGQSSYTQGDLLYADASGNLQKLAIGAAGKVLTSVGSLPSWQTPTGGGGSSGVGSGWATTTDNLAIYPATPSWVLIVGDSATSSTANAIFETHGTSYFSDTLAIASTSPSSAAKLDVSGSGYFTGGLGIGLTNSTNGTLKTSSDATIGGALTVTGATTLATTLGGLLKATSGLVSAATAGVDYENPLTFTYPLVRAANAISLAFGTTTSNLWGGTQTFTNNPILGTLSGLIYGNNGALSSAATTTVTTSGALSFASNPVVLGSSPYALSLNTDSTLAVSGGNLGLNLANPNTWTGLQQFNGNASSTQFTSTGNTYLATAGGKVGIGTTTPFAKLSVAALGTDTNTTLFAISSSTSAFATTTLFTVNNSGQTLFSDGVVGAPSISFNTDPTTGFYRSGSGAVSFSSGGVRQLLINGAGALQSDSGNGYELTRLTSLSVTAPNIIPNRNDTTTGFAAGSAGNINAIVGGSEVTRWTQTGFGVGTSSPFATLSVSTTTQGSATGALFAVASTTNATLFTVLGNGNVGLGTVSPAFTLDVRGGGNINFTGTLSANSATVITGGGFFRAAAGTAAGPGYTFSGATTMGLFNAAGALGFSTGGVEAGRFDTSGNFGIGTTTPFAKLSVNGSGAGTTNLFDIATSTAGFATSTALFVDSNGNLSLQNGASLTLSGATTTASNGINISAGCFAVGGNCIGTASSFTGTLAVANGGTGVSSLAGNSILYTNNAGNQVLTTSTSTLNIGGNAATASVAPAGTLTGGTLAANVLASSLTSVGTLSSLAVTGQTNLGTASSTAFSSGYASSTNAFFGNLSVGNLSGLLKAVGGAVSAAVAGTDYVAPGATFNTLFDNRLSATTTLPNLTTLAGLSLPVSQVSGISGTYPVQYSGGVISLAFGTTTANSWSALQQFNSNASTSQLSAFQKFYAGALATTTIDQNGSLAVAGVFSVSTTTATSTFAGGVSIPNLALTNNAGLLKASAGGYITNAIAGTDYLTSASGVTSIAQTYSGAGATGAITLATSSAATNNGVTVGQTITNTGGAFLFTPTVSVSNIPNAALANSTISGVALGGTLNALTFGTHLTSGGSSYNGSTGVTITSDATNANTPSTIVARDGSGNFSAGTVSAALSGNASTATALQTPRNINGVSFNGTADITVTADANTLTGTTLHNTVVNSSLTSVGTLSSLAVSGQTNLGFASTTGISTGYASSTNAFFGNLSIGNLSGLLKAAGGVVSAAVSGTDYAPATSGSSILYGNGTGGFSNATVNFPLSFTGGALSFNGLSTSTAAVVGNIPYYSGANTFANVATSSVTHGNGITVGGSAAVVGNGGVLISLADTAVTPTSYGDSTHVPTFVVDQQGRLTAAGTTNLDTSILTSGTLGIGRGGTGLNSYSGNQILYTNAAGSALLQTSTSTLSIGGNAGNVTGIVAVANGGTGWSAIQSGSIPYGNGTSALATTSSGTNGQTLALVAGIPTWVATTTAGTGLTYNNGAPGNFSVNTSQNITTLSNLTSAGFVKTNASGLLSVDTNTYLTGNQTITLSGDVSGSGTTAITTTIGANKVTLPDITTIAANSILGNVTGAPGNVTALSTSTLNIGGTAGNVTGIVAVTNGGTGVSSLLGNSILYTNAAGNQVLTTSTSTLNIGGNAATVTTNANLTGVITSSGNVTSLGTFNSLNLVNALSDETGTGAAVFAGSPTFTGILTTPNLTLSSFTQGSLLFAGAAGAVSQDNANFFWDDTNNRLGIGSTSPYAQLSVFAGGDYASHPLSTLFALGSSTAGTATTTLARFDSDGSFFLGNATDPSRSFLPTWDLGNSTAVSFDQIYQQFTTPPPSTSPGALATLDIHSIVNYPTTVPSTHVSGIRVTAMTDPANNSVITGLQGALLIGNNQSATNVTGQIIGLEAGGINSGSGMAVEDSGGWFVYGNEGSGSIMTASGIKIVSPFAFEGSPGNITNAYGIYIDDQNQGTNRWQFFSAGNSPSYFSGSLGIGSTTPFSQLSVSTTTQSSAATSLFAVASSTNATLFNVLGSGNVGIGTTSPGTLLSIGASGTGINFSLATSTFANVGGINLIGANPGCFAILGTCIGTNASALTSGTLALLNGGTATTTFYSGGVVFSDGTKLTQSAALANFAWDNVNSRLGLGTSTPFSTLSVSTTTQSAGTTSLFAVASSTNATLFNVLGGGQVGIGTTTPGSLFTISGTSSTTAAYRAVALGLSISTQNLSAMTDTAFTGSNVYANQIFSTQSNTTVSGGNTLGTYNEIFDNTAVTANQPPMIASYNIAVHSGSGTVTTLEGIVGTAINKSASTITNQFATILTSSNATTPGATTTNAYGINAQVTNTSPSGLITNARAFYALLTNSGATTTITNATGLYIDNLTNTGTNASIASTTGIYIGKLTAGTQTNTPYGIYDYDPSALNYFGGSVGIGTTTPYGQLSLGGGNLVLGAAAAGGTPGDLFLPKLGAAAGTFLAADPTGKVIATSTPTLSSLAGIVAVANGGTGLSSFSGNQMLYTSAAGTAFLQTATSTVTNGTGISIGGTGAVVGSGGLLITNTGVTSNVAGTGISVSGATGAVTITNTGVLALGPTGQQLSGSLLIATTSAAFNGLTASTTVTGVGNTLTFANTLAGLLGVGGGGTGASTLASNGVLYGNGTSAVQALAVNSTGTNKFLTQISSGVPAWSSISASDLPGSFAGFANPTASIGLTAVNGTAATAMRSDAAPALSVAIVPTWTGTHTFSNGTFSALFTGGNVGVGTANPQAKLDIQGIASSTTFYANLGSASAPAFTFAGDTNNGIYSSAADNLNFGTNGVSRMQISESGDIGINIAPQFYAKLYVNNATTTLVSVIGVYNTVSAITETPASASTVNLFALDSEATWAGSANSSASGRLTSVQAKATVTGSASVNTATGLANQTIGGSTGTIGTAIGGAYTVSEQGSSGTGGSITNAYAGTFTNGVNVAGGSITTSKAIWVSATSISGGGTITNNHGLYVDDESGGTNNINIYTGPANVNPTGTFSIYDGSANMNYFKGATGIGMSAPGSALEVQGTTTDATANALIIVNSGLANLFNVRNDGNVGIGTTTPGTLLSIGASGTGINFSLATSTFANVGGINLIGANPGCFAILGTCIGTNASALTSGTLALLNGGTATTTFYSGGVVFSDGTKLTQSAALANFAWDNVNSRLGLGTSTPFSTLSVSTTTQSAGTTSLFAVASTTNATLFTVLGNGKVGIGTTSPSSLLTIVGSTPGAASVYSDSVQPYRVQDLSVLVNAPSSGSANYIHQLVSTQSNETGLTGGVLIGIESDLFDTAGNSSTQTALYGINSQVTHFGSGTVNNGIIGGNFVSSNSSSGTTIPSNVAVAGLAINSVSAATSTGLYGVTGTVDNHAIYTGATTGAGLYSFTNTAGNSKMTNSYGVLVNNIANGGTITNAYGVFVGSMTTGGGAFTNTPYSFYASDSSALNYFGGKVGIGSTTPWRTLDVNGTVSFKGLTTSPGGIQTASLCLSANNEVIAETSGTCLTSSENYKNTIVASTAGLAEVMALRPVSFYYDSTGNPSFDADPNHASQQLGFIAQQAAAVDSRLAIFNSDGSVQGFRYENFTAVLTGAIHEMEGAVDTTAFHGSASSTAPVTIDISGNVGVGTAAPNAKLAVTGNVFAASYETTSSPALSFTLGSTTLVAQIPSSVLTANGTVDIYKLATYDLSGISALAAKLDAQDTRLMSLESRVSALENGSITNASGTGFVNFSTSTLASALQSFGVFLQQGIAQFGTLVADQFVAATNSAGTSSAGTVTILAGNTVAQVNNSYVKPSSKIFVTFTASTTASWYISDKQNGSFKLILSAPQQSDTSFDYFIVQTEGQIATSTPQGGPSVSQSNGPDTVAPVITLLGDNPVHVSVGGAYVEPGVSVTDNADGSDSYTTFVNGVEQDASTLDTSAPTTYIITYSATDHAGNLATAHRSVIVGDPDGIVTTGGSGSGTGTTTPPSSDTSAPIVTLNGSAALQLTVGDTFTDPGATATDDTDGDLTTHILVSGTVDTATAGLYTLTYTATDAAGNSGSASRAVSVVASSTPGN